MTDSIHTLDNRGTTPSANASAALGPSLEPAGFEYWKEKKFFQRTALCLALRLNSASPADASTTRTSPSPFAQPDRATAIEVNFSLTVVGHFPAPSGIRRDLVRVASEPAGHTVITARNKHKRFL